MREDIVGMLKNALEHGGNPVKVAQSLINSGYPLEEVKAALQFISKEQQEQTQQDQQDQNQKPKTHQVPKIMPVLSQEPQEFEKDKAAKDLEEQKQQAQQQNQKLSQQPIPIQKTSLQNQQIAPQNIKPLIQEQNKPFAVQQPQKLNPQLQAHMTSQTTQAIQKNPMPQVPVYNPKEQKLSPLKPLPSVKSNPTGTGKIIILFILLFLLAASLAVVIVFKDKVLELLG